jgi:hypothetical protein
MSSPESPQQFYTNQSSSNRSSNGIEDFIYAHMSSSQVANCNYWLNGLAPVATNIVTPLITYLVMRSKIDKTLLQKYNQQVNEVGRQLVSGTIGLLSYFGGAEITRYLLKLVLGSDTDQKVDKASRQIAMSVGGVITSFLGFAILRPLLSTDLICKFLKQEGAEEITFNLKEMRLQLEKSAKALKHQSVEDRMAEIIREKRVSMSVEKKGNHWFFGPIQNWVDRHLVPNGVPKLGKTAAYATLTLSVYLGTLTAALWSINRLLGKTAMPANVSPVVAPHQGMHFIGNFQNARFSMLPRPNRNGLMSGNGYYPYAQVTSNYGLPWR